MHCRSRNFSVEKGKLISRTVTQNERTKFLKYIIRLVHHFSKCGPCKPGVLTSARLDFGARRMRTVCEAPSVCWGERRAPSAFSLRSAAVLGDPPGAQAPDARARGRSFLASRRLLLPSSASPPRPSPPRPLPARARRRRRCPVQHVLPNPRRLPSRRSGCMPLTPSARAHLRACCRDHLRALRVGRGGGVGLRRVLDDAVGLSMGRPMCA